MARLAIDDLKQRGFHTDEDALKKMRKEGAKRRKQQAKEETKVIGRKRKSSYIHSHFKFKFAKPTPEIYNISPFIVLYLHAGRGCNEGWTLLRPTSC